MVKLYFSEKQIDCCKRHIEYQVNGKSDSTHSKTLEAAQLAAESYRE
jgi:hypothetical protein